MSSGSFVRDRTAPTRAGPNEMFGTKWPSITSRWNESAPPASATRIADARSAKSALRREGASRRRGALSTSAGTLGRYLGDPASFRSAQRNSLGSGPVSPAAGSNIAPPPAASGVHRPYGTGRRNEGRNEERRRGSSDEGRYQRNRKSRNSR